jgi:hypothetical protein
MSSKGFGQIRYRNKRGFQVPDTSFWMIVVIFYKKIDLICQSIRAVIIFIER